MIPPPSEDTFVTIVVVRHGQTQWNAEGRWQGTMDSPLTTLGREQALLARSVVTRYAIDLAFSSPAGRARETARIILADTAFCAQVEPELRERHYGVYEGLTAREIEERYPGTRFRECGGSRETWAPPQGETMAQVRDRVRHYLLGLARRYPGRTILLVTHSGIVRAIDSLCLGRNFDELWHRVPKNGCVYVARVYAAGRFECLEDCFEEPAENLLNSPPAV